MGDGDVADRSDLPIDGVRSFHRLITLRTWLNAVRSLGDICRGVIVVDVGVMVVALRLESVFELGFVYVAVSVPDTVYVFVDTGVRLVTVVPTVLVTLRESQDNALCVRGGGDSMEDIVVLGPEYDAAEPVREDGRDPYVVVP